jgi:hypothetical protein
MVAPIVLQFDLALIIEDPILASPGVNGIVAWAAENDVVASPRHDRVLAADFDVCGRNLLHPAMLKLDLAQATEDRVE